LQPEEEGLMEEERLAVEEGEGEMGDVVPYAHRDIKPGMIVPFVLFFLFLHPLARCRVYLLCPNSFLLYSPYFFSHFLPSISYKLH
jgi:hypothetical protein